MRGEAGCREARRSPAPPAPGRTLPPQHRGPGAGAGRRARCSPLFPPSFHLQLYNCPPPLPALPPRRMRRCEGKSSRRGAARRSSTPSPSPGRPPLPAQVGAAPGGMGRGGQGLAPSPWGALSPKQLHRAQGGGCPAATCGDSPGEGRWGPERSRRERARLLGAGDRSVEPEGKPLKNCRSRIFKDN